MNISSRKFFLIAVGFILCLAIIFSISIFLFITDSQLPTLSNIKEIGESFKPIVEIIAIIIAGLWSYRIFIKNRVEYPFGEIKHNISHWNLGEGKFYLSVIVTVKNAGNVLIVLESGKIYVQRVRPLSDDLKGFIQDADTQKLRGGEVEHLFHDKGSKISWDELGYREPHWEDGEVSIEPGETEEFQYDFILSDSVQTIRVITYFRNIKFRSPEIGWRLTTLYDLKGDHNESGKRNPETESG